MQSWKTSTSYFWEEAPFFRLLLPLMVAIVCYDYHFIPKANYNSLLFSLIFSCFILVLFSFQKNANKFFAAIKSLLIFLSFFILGWFVSFAFDIQNDVSWFGNHLSKTDFFEAKIITQPTEKDRTWKLEVAVNKAIQGNNVIATQGNAVLYLYKNENGINLQQGDKILLPNKWTAIKNPGNPFEFDYARFAKRQNIFYQSFLSNQEIEKITSVPEAPLTLIKWHDWSMNKLAHYVKDTAALGMLQAMLLGDKTNFDDDQRQLYAQTGIIHVVAISGAHVFFLFFIISSCFFWIKNKKYSWVKYAIALPLVWLYVLLAGAPPSAIRAATMFSFISLGFIFYKNSNSLNQLFAAAFIILLSHPFWLFAVGFQLSFLAVLSLIIFYKRTNRLWFPQNYLLGKLWNVIAASISVEILIAPLVVFYFHIFPVAFIFSNIIAWMVMSIVMSCGLLILLFNSVPIIASLIGILVSYIVHFFNLLLSWIQLLNPTSFKLLYLSDVQLLLLYAFIICLSIYFIQKYKSSLFFGLSSLLLFLIVISWNQWQHLHQRKFIAYNINRSSYAELIKGNLFIPILNDSTDERTKNYATKELHIATHCVNKIARQEGNLLQIDKAHLLILNTPIFIDSSANLGIDYLMINYPIKEFNAIQLRELFHFKKLIISSNQKRYLAEQWRDSCLKYNMYVHFTQFDGAFTLSD